MVTNKNQIHNMENNKVTFAAIQKKSAGELGLIAKLVSIVIVVIVIAVIYCIDLRDAQKIHLVGYATFGIIGLNILAYFIGKYSNYLQKKACLSWYAWDKNRIGLFNEEKRRWREKFENELQVAVGVVLVLEPETREQIKEEVIRMVKDMLLQMQTFSDSLNNRLSDEEIELVRILQKRSEIETLQERMTEWLLDFINELKAEAENEDLVRRRIEEVLRTSNIPVLNARLAFYDALIDSCEKSTNELAKILKERYAYQV